jgi:cation transport ATPase
MLTGDNERTANALAGPPDLAQVEAAVEPQDKQDKYERVKQL